MWVREMFARHKIRQLFGPRQRVTVDNAQVPEGVRIYAVGDIHGRNDLLRRLHARIVKDAQSASANLRRVVIYLGDYVDRGLHSREVVDMLLDDPLPGFEAYYLKGNHDQQLLDFLASPASGANWMRYGGDATLYSYGIRFPKDQPRELHLKLMSEQLREVIPPRHLDFFQSLKLIFEAGDYLFVHAGIHPEKRMDEQTADDMLWIREEFLESDADLGKVVVHGHSVTDLPEVRDNRIGVDTGAVFSNRLSCLVLEGSRRRFLSTRD